jgi:hypothetical protein
MTCCALFPVRLAPLPPLPPGRLVLQLLQPAPIARQDRLAVLRRTMPASANVFNHNVQKLVT